MTSVASKQPNKDNSNFVMNNICVYNSSNVHFGSEIQYDAPLSVQQYVTGLPEELVSKPEIGHGLAKAGLIAATTSAVDHATTPSMTLLLPASKTENEHKLRVWWLTAAAVLVVLTVVLACTLSLHTTSAEIPSRVILPPNSEATYNPFLYTEGTNVTLSGKLRVIARIDWLAQPTNLHNDTNIAHNVIVTETNGDECLTEAKCKLMVQLTQQNDIRKNLSDIAPSFFLAGDGYAYEGRGWGISNQCTLVKNIDQNSICIAFIGTFKTASPSHKQLIAAKQVIDMGISLGKIVENYAVYGLRQVAPNFKFPGEKLYQMIQEWPNWRLRLIS